MQYQQRGKQMEGLHLSEKCFPDKAAYGIRSIVNVLAPELSQMYCVTHKDFLEYSLPGGKALSDEEYGNLSEQYAGFLLEEVDRVGNSVQDLKLFERGFLTKFRDYLYGDWTDFYLLAKRIPLTLLQPWSSQLPPECQILISCIDQAYWEVYARDTSVLARIKEQFPRAEPCRLENKRV